MSDESYSRLVREHFANTEHAGDLAGAVAINADEQGIRLKLSATVKKGHIQALRFRAWGCPHVIAACEWFCSRYEGQPGESLSGFQASDIMCNLSVPVEKTGRILVLEDAVRSLGQRIGGGSAP
ncbi:MAG: iron-sulfur cluster assembly scaffold protein [Gammaproteobacteria bacterium]|nr:iron-sulfur cluster assembly scaffold protein [Gammaproteobacteria bacterium]MBT8111264.1 iron-sulfur cluster assembly scaffold protein [Gammaproteobacteria bacterium]NND47454.1 hypothetical protein [Woeseiaceae bacterium]NNL45962.1 hypothetical protein [Woeseiaceae bacterium]